MYSKDMYSKNNQNSNDVAFVNSSKMNSTVQARIVPNTSDNANSINLDANKSNTTAMPKIQIGSVDSFIV